MKISLLLLVGASLSLAASADPNNKIPDSENLQDDGDDDENEI